MLTLIETLPSSTTEFFRGLEMLPFSNRPSSRDPADAWFCAEAAALAYKDAEFVAQLGTELQAHGWNIVHFWDEPSTALLLRNEESAVLAFRGTRTASFPDLFRTTPINLCDLATDFSAALQPHRTGGRVHQGFYEAFTKFWSTHGESVLRSIGNRSLFLAGHSLGGALATIAARELPFAAALYTFGSPLVGDESFREGFEDSPISISRFVHGFDLVTTVPPMEIGYRHVGTIIHIEGGKGYTVGTQSQHSLLESITYNLTAFPTNIRNAMRALFDGRIQTLPDIPMPADALTDHAPMNYTIKLRLAAARHHGIEINEHPKGTPIEPTHP